MYRLLSILPFNHISYFLGMLFRLPLPQPLARLSVFIFAKIVSADFNTAEKDYREYRTISDFFNRNLKPGIRPLEAGLVSPVDGYLRRVDKIQSDWLEQVKGKQYSLARLIDDPQRAQKFIQGWSLSLYLSPRDYHQVHAPADAEIIAYQHIPGRLWPVNNWALNNVDQLFSENERVVIYLQTIQFGLVALVMVGALNVGSIRLEFSQLATNTTAVKPATVIFQSPLKISRGDKLAAFQLGSSVILLLEKPHELAANNFVRSSDSVKYGQTLLLA